MQTPHFDSKSIEIAKKIRPFITERNKNDLIDKIQFMTLIRNLVNTQVLTSSEYSYIIANYLRMVINLNLYHLLINNQGDPYQRLIRFWEDVTKQILNVTARNSKFGKIKAIEDKFSVLVGNLTELDSKNLIPVESKDPFDKAQFSVQELESIDQNNNSYSSFQESLKECQKILFELKEELSLNEVISPVLYEITKEARELPRNYTNRNDLIKNISNKLNIWKNRLKDTFKNNYF